MMRLLRAFGPAVPWPKPAEALRAALGAAFGLAAVALALQWFGAGPELGLIAPFGASAFLIFAVPNSPLAQPWSVIAGSAVSALVGVGAVHLPLPLLADAALAVGGAILAMAACRAMHPPAGAVALLVVLGADPAALPGPGFALVPVAEGTALLVLTGILWNRLTGRVYPFRQPPAQGPHGTADPAPDRRMGLGPAELQAILNRLRLSPNLGPEDLGRAVEAAEAEATARHLGGLTADAIMSRDLVTLAPETPVPEIAALFGKHGFDTLPVTLPDGTFAGLVEDHALIGADPALMAADLARPVPSVKPDAGLAELIGLISDERQQTLPILSEGRLCGLVTRSDLIALLARKVRGQEPMP